MKKVFAVIDTNVLVSSLLKEDSNPRKIIQFIIDGTIVPVLNDEIFFEYKNVLSRDKFNFAKSAIQKVINLFEVYGVFVDRTKSSDFFVDEKDIVFYEVTLTANKISKTYLVTGNLKHFPIKTFVVSPREMVETILKLQ